MDVYVMLIQDRHADPDVELFLDKDEALDQMRKLAEDYNNHPEDLEEHELDDDMIKDGYVGSMTYSCEGDGISVFKRELAGM